MGHGWAGNEARWAKGGYWCVVFVSGRWARVRAGGWSKVSGAGVVGAGGTGSGQADNRQGPKGGVVWAASSRGKLASTPEHLKAHRERL